MYALTMTALILFGTTSGNTAYLSKFIENGLRTAGYEVTRKNVKEAEVSELAQYDLVVLGSSTWDGPKQEGLSMREQAAHVQGRLQVDMRAFVEKMDGMDLQQKPMAVWGVGHTSYTYTCNAAHLLEEAVTKANGRLIVDTFRVTDIPDLFADAIEQWAGDIRLS